MSQREKISFRSKRLLLIAGIFVLLVAALFEVVAIESFRGEGRDGVIAIVLISLVFVGGLVFGGVALIYSFFINGKGLRKAVQTYGEEQLLRNINEKTERVFRKQFFKGEVYFTDRFVIDPREAVIEYKDISMMYKQVNRSRYGNISYIAFLLRNGGTAYLCAGIKDEEIWEIMNLCYQKRPDILFGYTRENQEKHKRRCEQYKSGEVSEVEVKANDSVRSDLENTQKTTVASKEQLSELPKPWEWTPEGQKYGIGKRMFGVGIIAMAMVPVLFCGMIFVLKKDLDKKVDFVSEKELEEFLDFDYEEYKTVGGAVYRKLNYNIDELSTRELHLMRDLYIYKLQDGGWLGIRQGEGWYLAKDSLRSGWDIFYSGDSYRKQIEISDVGVLDVLVIEDDDISARYGIKSARYASELFIIFIVTATMGGIVLSGATVMVLLGKKQMKKYSKNI